MGPEVHRSFNFNKLRSFLISRELSSEARVGVELDSDQFVGPGVDYMLLDCTEPLNKSHAANALASDIVFFQADTPHNVWWQRYCPDPPACKPHMMRWSHAHPTSYQYFWDLHWRTFWSLPFIGRWLRRHFRDEKLGRRQTRENELAGLQGFICTCKLPRLLFATTGEGLQLGELPVSKIPEDEDLLNVATWEASWLCTVLSVAIGNWRAPRTKQWCKFDNDYHEFADMLSWNPQMLGWVKVVFTFSVVIYYVNSLDHGKAFFTAHNCKDPAATATWQIPDLQRIHPQEIKSRWDQGRYPPSTITFKGRFWDSGSELRKAAATHGL
eukprot:Skav217896  [mRNA]  locus=scaffold795:17569:20668:+ [translate_table: standard]